jgi:hypothetical protein
MPLLVSSAKGANGAGYGAILAFDFVGNALGTFCDDSGRITGYQNSGGSLKWPPTTFP